MKVSIRQSTYKTPRMVFSIESFQDIDEAISNINLFKQVPASRLARGIAKHLVIERVSKGFY